MPDSCVSGTPRKQSKGTASGLGLPGEHHTWRRESREDSDGDNVKKEAGKLAGRVFKDRAVAQQAAQGTSDDVQSSFKRKGGKINRGSSWFRDKQ